MFYISFTVLNLIIFSVRYLLGELNINEQFENTLYKSTVR